jgi:hypothetical protein
MALGWCHAFQGHLSSAWRSAFLAQLQTTTKSRETLSHSWAKRVISALWTFSFSIWEFQNATVHGKTTEAQDGKWLKQLKAKDQEYYESYKNDKYLVPHSCTYLFDRPIQILLQLRQQQLQSWIASVEEAIATRKSREQHHLHSQQSIMHRFLGILPIKVQHPVVKLSLSTPARKSMQRRRTRKLTTPSRGCHRPLSPPSPGSDEESIFRPPFSSVGSLGHLRKATAVSPSPADTRLLETKPLLDSTVS